MNFDKFLPPEYASALGFVNADKLNEIRFRANQPTAVLVDGKKYFLSSKGATILPELALKSTSQTLEKILLAACRHSIYAYNSQIIKGFLTVGGGVRIGVCGAVVENEKILSIKDVSALCIRVPRAVCGCAKPILKYVKPICNLLVVSPPGCGKTTMLRDLVCQFSSEKLNVLLCDERNEIAAVDGGEATFCLPNCDIMTFGEKKFVIEAGIRSMSPELIVCDEILPEDMPILTTAAQSGVNIFASMHARDIFEVSQKIGTNTIFDRFLVLSNRNGIGTIEGVFGKDLKKL